MNRYRKVVLVGALLNVLVLLMFPPYDVAVLGRGLPMFDAFYPVFSAPGNRTVNGDLLYMLVMAVLVNAAIAWLLLSRHPAYPERTLVSPQNTVIAMAVLNLFMALLFPPMEAFPFAQRVTVGTFDGFYFAFGDKARRAIFVPLLYMGVLFILVNAFAYWLAMSVVERRAASGADEAGPLTMLDEAAILRARAEAKLGAGTQAAALGKRGPDRRRRKDAGYPGPERRRQGNERRNRR
jgi:hypothetical protein